MKKIHLLLSAFLLLALSPAGAELENGDFATGKSKWRGPGKVDKIKGASVLTVALSKHQFSEVTQAFNATATTKRLKITAEVQASKDYVFNDKSRNISDVNFKIGGYYIWSALVLPKADFQFRLKDDYYLYKLAAVPAGGSWTTVTAEMKDIKKPASLELALVFPPGDGTIMVKNVRVEELKD